MCSTIQYIFFSWITWRYVIDSDTHHPQVLGYVIPTLLHVISFCLRDVILKAGISFLAPPPSSPFAFPLSLKNGTHVTTEHSWMVTRASTLGYNHDCRRSHSIMFPPVTLDISFTLSRSKSVSKGKDPCLTFFSVSSRDPQHRTCFQSILLASTKIQKYVLYLSPAKETVSTPLGGFGVNWTWFHIHTLFCCLNF